MPNNIAVIWDFDGTLTPDDSTTKTVEALDKDAVNWFWQYVKSLRGDKRRPQWEHILASDAPIWMYSLSKLAKQKQIPLNKEFFWEYVRPKIELFPNVIPFMENIKNLEQNKEFKEVDLKIYHFVVSAGLKDLIEQVFPSGLVKWTFGCRYEILAGEDKQDKPESVPVFCMDETMKTRSLFEISKGSFEKSDRSVNRRVAEEKLWVPFRNMIYIGDGDTDIPALSLVRNKGGLGLVVFNPELSEDDVNKRLQNIRKDKRSDFITEADFSQNGALFTYIQTRCFQIMQRYKAEKMAQS